MTLNCLLLSALLTIIIIVMKTSIYPNEKRTMNDGTVVNGFVVGREFIAMSEHKGHVGLLPTRSLRYRFCKSGNNKAALYAGQHYELVIKPITEPIAENELMTVAKSQGLRLVILDNRTHQGT